MVLCMIGGRGEWISVELLIGKAMRIVRVIIDCIVAGIVARIVAGDVASRRCFVSAAESVGAHRTAIGLVVLAHQALTGVVIVGTITARQIT